MALALLSNLITYQSGSPEGFERDALTAEFNCDVTDPLPVHYRANDNHVTIQFLAIADNKVNVGLNDVTIRTKFDRRSSPTRYEIRRISVPLPVQDRR